MTTKAQEILRTLEIEKLDVLTLLTLRNAIHTEIGKKEDYLFEVSARDWKGICKEVYESKGLLSAIRTLRNAYHAGLSQSKHAIQKWASEEGWVRPPGPEVFNTDKTTNIDDVF